LSRAGRLRVRISGKEVQLGGNARAKHLADLLRHPNILTRYRAVFTLAKERDNRVLGDLINILTVPHPFEPPIRKLLLERTIWALDRLADSRAADALLSVSIGRYESELCEQAAIAASNLDYGRCIEFYRERLSDPREAFRARVYAALSWVGGRAAMQLLADTALQEQSSYRKLQALDAFEHCEPDDYVASRIMEQCLDDQNTHFLTRGLRIYARMMQDEAIDALHEFIRRVERRFPRMIAIAALGQVETRQSVDVLISLLNELPDTGLRLEIVSAIARIERPDSVEDLVELIGTSDAETNRLAEIAVRRSTIGEAVRQRALLRRSRSQ